MTFLLTLLGYIPIVGPIVHDWVKGYYDSKTQILTAQVGGARDIAVTSMQTRVAGLSVIAGSKLLTLLVVAFAAPLVIFEWKVVVVDIVFQAGNTDPIRGQVAEWANTIITCLFGSTAVVTATSILARIWK